MGRDDCPLLGGKTQSTRHPLSVRYRLAFNDSITADDIFELARGLCQLIAARCYASAAYAVMRCVSVCVCPSLSYILSKRNLTNKHISIFFSPSGSHTILVFPYQTAWHYSANGGVECGRGMQKSRRWAKMWLHCVLWSVPAASAIH